jgi:hypothetical protein
VAYKQTITKKKQKKKSKKKITTNSNLNMFNNKKNSVDSVGNSINGPYLSPFFSSRDGRPSTILKNGDSNMMHLDVNNAINLLQYNNMVTVDSIKSKKSKKIIPLKDKVAGKQSKRRSTTRNNKNDSSSTTNRVSDAYPKDKHGGGNLKHLSSNNSFGPEAYFGADLVQKNVKGSNFFTEGAPSVNESH